jgi:hypothetical protein
MKRLLTASIILLLVIGFQLSTGATAQAGDDPSIKGELRENIKSSMAGFIDRNTINGVYDYFDPLTGKLISLKLDYLHEGIVRNGPFFVSCADMIDQNSGKVVDMDFFVKEDGGELITTQAIVHKADGKKRKYHLEKVKTKH